MARQGFGHDLILLAERAECTIEIDRAQRGGGGDQLACVQCEPGCPLPRCHARQVKPAD